jgi:zinc transporter 1/2/3
MSIVIYKVIASFLMLIVSLLSVIYPLKIRAKLGHHHCLELGDAFASGIFLGVALFHMLPSSDQYFHQLLPTLNYPMAELLCAVGFLVLLFFECLATVKLRFSYIVAFIIKQDYLLEGLALGNNQSIISALFVFFAIFAHKGSESFALAITLNRDAISLKKMIAIIIIFSLMTPLGILGGTGITLFLENQYSLLLTAIFNAFAAGTFLYISTLHHLNHHKSGHQHERLWEFLVLVLGLALMAVAAIYT